MLRANKESMAYGVMRVLGDSGRWGGQAAVARFAEKVNSFGPLAQASAAQQIRLLEEVKIVARCIDGHRETSAESGYGRRVLYEEPGRWSLAAIILRPGQQTEQHNHSGWGCAVTVQGVERDRRFTHDVSGDLLLDRERDYPTGTGYVFNAVDVHQPVGVDQRRATVSLHFLVHDNPHNQTYPEVIRSFQRHIDNAA